MSTQTKPHVIIPPRIATLCQYIEMHAHERLTLAELAQTSNLSAYHLQRQFKAALGVTPYQYHQACRIRLLKQALRNHSTGGVADAIFEVGFSSGSRVYESSDNLLGMTPRQYRSGGKGLKLDYVCTSTPLGLLMLAASDRGLCFVQFGENESALLDQLRIEFPLAQLQAARPIASAFTKWINALNNYLSGSRPAPHPESLALDLLGTVFQIKVWTYLRQIPFGQVQTYAEVAQGIGAPRAVRAVASACAANRIAILIPCHRVIRSDGGMGGYKWGMPRKEALLAMEKMPE